MEKENARLQARQNEHEIKRIKLVYDDICECPKFAIDIWDEYLENQARITQKIDHKVLLQAIRNGKLDLLHLKVYNFFYVCLIFCFKVFRN